MNKCFTNITAALAIGVITIAGGCSSEIKSVGRRNAAANTSFNCQSQKIITAECIARYFGIESNTYITTQCHRINPSTDSMVILSEEPDAIYKFTLKKGELSLKKRSKSPELEAQIDSLLDNESAYLLYQAAIISSKLVDYPITPANKNNTLRINGVWYSTTERHICYNGSKTGKLKIYSRCDSGKLEWFDLICKESDKKLSAYCYNFSDISGFAYSLPTKIDLFCGSAEDYEKQQFAQFEYVKLQAE